MARTAVAPTKIAADTAAALTTVSADPTNGHSVSFDDARDGVTLVVANTAGGAKAATVVAADGTGDLVVSVPAGETRFIHVAESAKFGHTGELHVDLEAGTTGTVGAIVTRSFFYS